jgi:tyrosyl-tRNA synthetase
MYGKMMSIPDSLIIPYLELLTTCTYEMLKHIKSQLDSGTANPKNVKAELSKWIVGEYHSREEANAAEEAFIKQFQKHEIPEDIVIEELSAGQSHHLPSLMAQYGLAPSKTEARRLIQGGGVKLSGQKIEDEEYQLTGQPNEEMILQVGRRRFLKLLFR